MRRPPMPSWPVLAGVLLLAGLTYLTLRPVPTTVDTARVTRGPVTAVIAEEGRTRVRQRFVVATPLDGEVSRVAVEPGDVVRAGRTRIATVRPGPAALLDARAWAAAAQTAVMAAAAEREARAETARATAWADRARRDLGRQTDLAAAGLTTPQSLEAAQADARAAEAAVRAAEAAATRASAELERARLQRRPPAGAGPPWLVLAPVDGVVLRRLRESGGPAPAGTPLVELGDPRDLEVVVDLLTSDAVRVAQGGRVRLAVSPAGPSLEGRIRRVEPGAFTAVSALGVEEQRVNVVIDPARGPGTPALAAGDDYRVDAEFVLDVRGEVLRVPPGALFRDGRGWAVFTSDGRRARKTRVEVGLRSEDYVEVRRGLAENTVVVLYPPDDLRERSRLTHRVH